MHFLFSVFHSLGGIKTSKEVASVVTTTATICMNAKKNIHISIIYMQMQRILFRLSEQMY